MAVVAGRLRRPHRRHRERPHVACDRRTVPVVAVTVTSTAEPVGPAEPGPAWRRRAMIMDRREIEATIELDEPVGSLAPRSVGELMTADRSWSRSIRTSARGELMDSYQVSGLPVVRSIAARWSE